MDSKLNEGASNRISYAVFRSVSSIHCVNGNTYKSHKDALGQFNKNYANEGIFPREYGKKIYEIQSIRHDSDYGYNKAPSDAKVKENFLFAKKLYQECKKYCEKELNKSIQNRDEQSHR